MIFRWADSYSRLGLNNNKKNIFLGAPPPQDRDFMVDHILSFWGPVYQRLLKRSQPFLIALIWLKAKLPTGNLD